MRYRVRVEYDGTDFHGFQLQPGRRTVQGELERVLAQISAGRRVRVDAAGRTDAGVHARGQVIAFTYAGSKTADELQRSLDALLPRDIGLGPLRRVPRSYHPRYRASQREYRYAIWNGPPSPLRERYAFGVREPLDVAAMDAAAGVLVGRHDFSAFGGSHGQPVRTLHRVEVRRSGRLITIVVVGDAFLRQMVRRLVAVLLRAGRGEASPADIRQALEAAQPAFEGDTAPPHGLCLWRVAFGRRQEDKSHRNENRKSDEHEQDI